MATRCVHLQPPWHESPLRSGLTLPLRQQVCDAHQRRRHGGDGAVVLQLAELVLPTRQGEHHRSPILPRVAPSEVPTAPDPLYGGGEAIRPERLVDFFQLYRDCTDISIFG